MSCLPEMVPLLFIHTVTGALIAAVPIGLMGGFATAAYMDLIIRSSPPGLQSTTLMMSGGLYFIAVRFGDVLRAYLYSYFGLRSRDHVLRADHPNTVPRPRNRYGNC